MLVQPIHLFRRRDRYEAGDGESARWRVSSEMSRRKLKALGYSEQKTFEINDEAQYRSLVAWLEDQKVRQLKIEERGPLRDLDSATWPAVYGKYLSELKCPLPSSDRAGCLEWLLGLAIRLEYSDNAEKYRSVEPKPATPAEAKSVGGRPSSAGRNPLADLDYQSAEFKAAVTSLQCLLQLPAHPDHLELLKAVNLLVQERLSKDRKPSAAASTAAGSAAPATLSLKTIDAGIDTGDYVVNDAARILRLLHLRELRDLQTRINEAIVAVQALVADPKTDQRLGRIGR